MCMGQTMEIKSNKSKSVHINFTNRKIDPLRVYNNGLEVPYANTAEYLCITMDRNGKSMKRKRRRGST